MFIYISPDGVVAGAGVEQGAVGAAATVGPVVVVYVDVKYNISAKYANQIVSLYLSLLYKVILSVRTWIIRAYRQ